MTYPADGDTEAMLKKSEGTKFDPTLPPSDPEVEWGEQQRNPAEGSSNSSKKS